MTYERSLIFFILKFIISYSMHYLWNEFCLILICINLKIEGYYQWILNLILI